MTFSVGLIAFLLGSTEPQPAVQLLNAGDEPRATVRYDLSPGQSIIQLDWQVNAAILRGVLQGEELPGPLLSAVLEIDLGNERNGGRMPLWVTVRAARILEHVDGMPEAEHQAFHTALDNMLGMMWRGSVSPRGLLVWQESPPGLDAATNRIVEEIQRALQSHLFVATPAEPIGKGAKWAMTQAAKIGFVTHLLEERTYTLEQHDGSTMVVSWTLDVRAMGKLVDLGRATITIAAASTQGRGRAHRPLGAIFPAFSDQTVEVRLTLKPSDLVGATDQSLPLFPDEEHTKAAQVAIFKSREVLRGLGPLILGPWRPRGTQGTSGALIAPP